MKTLYKPFLTTTALLMVLTAFFGCNVELGERGNGSIITENIETGTFHQVELLGNFRINLRKATEESVVIVTDENLMDYITVENVNGTLKIGSTRKIRPSDDSNIIINYTFMDRIDVQGAASLRSDGVFEGDRLRWIMSGAGEVDMDIDLRHFELDISGAGAVKLRGNVVEQDISMSGAGGYDAKELVSRICNISISGVGGAKVHVTDDLTASVSGAGGVSYSGNPAEVRAHISGLGSVSASDDPS